MPVTHIYGQLDTITGCASGCLLKSTENKQKTLVDPFFFKLSCGTTNLIQIHVFSANVLPAVKGAHTIGGVLSVHKHAETLEILISPFAGPRRCPSPAGVYGSRRSEGFCGSLLSDSYLCGDVGELNPSPVCLIGDLLGDHEP